jgi:hypothetical protein
VVGLSQICHTDHDQLNLHCAPAMTSHLSEIVLGSAIVAALGIAGYIIVQPSRTSVRQRADLELFALVLGDAPPLKRVFSITAKASDSVAKLRKLVYEQKKNRFKGIDASDLVLWKVLPLCDFRCMIC